MQRPRKKTVWIRYIAAFNKYFECDFRMGQTRKTLQNAQHTTCIIIQFAKAISSSPYLTAKRKTFLLIFIRCLPTFCLTPMHESYYIQIFIIFAKRTNSPENWVLSNVATTISFLAREWLSAKLTSEISFVEMFRLIFEGIENRTVVNSFPVVNMKAVCEASQILRWK